MVKRLTTLTVVLACVLGTSVASASDLFSEDWESGTIDPAKWATSVSGGTFDISVNTNWNATPGGQYSLNSDPANLYHNSNMVATSPPLSTVGETACYVVFQFLAKDASELERSDWLRVNYSTDSVTWHTIWEITDGLDANWHLGFVQLPPEAIGVAQLWIQFEMRDSDGSPEVYGVDDIYVGDNLPVSAVTRALPATYAPGSTFTVSLTASPWISAGAFTTTETLPAGLVPSNPVPSTGTATIVGNQVIWNVADNGAATQTLTYDVQVPTTWCVTWIRPQGIWDAGGVKSAGVGGDRYVRQADDGWNNAPIPWTGALDIGDVGAPGFTYWFQCGDVYELGGAGADVWGWHDECQYLYTWVSGDFTLAGNVLLTIPVEDNTKCGLMMRENISTRSATITTEVSERNEGGYDMQGISVQIREAWNTGMARIVHPRIWNWGNCYLALTRKVTPDGARVAIYADAADGAPGWSGMQKLYLNDIGSDEITSPRTRNLSGVVAVGLYIVGHNEPLVGEGRISEVSLTSTTSLLDIDPGTVTRQIPTPGYVPGGAAVPVTLVANPGSGTGQIVTTETLPAGWTASNVVASAGTVDTSVPGQIVWTVNMDGVNQQTLSYDANPPAGSCDYQSFSGVYDTGLAAAVGWDASAHVTPVGGDSVVSQLPGAGDIWQNAPISWDGAVDIGTVDAAGRSDWFACDGRYEIIGSGFDIWGNGDEFQFLYTIVVDDFEISADVDWTMGGLNPTPPDSWAKAGIFLRDNLSPGSPYVGEVIRWGDGDRALIAQWRDTQDGGSSSAGAPANGPIMLYMNREGTTVTLGYDDHSGNADMAWWTRGMPNISRVSVVGLGTTSHSDGALAVCRFENVATTFTVDKTAVLFCESVTRDVPSTYAAGGQVPVALTAVPYSWATPGLMVTTETVPLDLTVSNIVPSAGTTTTISTTGGLLIVWTVNNFSSTATLTYDVNIPTTACRDTFDFSGVFWNGVEESPVTGDPNLPGWGYDTSIPGPIGMVDDGLAATGLPLAAMDIGGVGYPGASQFFLCDGAFMLYGGGRDIWDSADEFQFLYIMVQGDFSVESDVTLLSLADWWTKAGLMVRDNFTPGSPNAMILIRGEGQPPDGSHGIRAQIRFDQDGGSWDTGAPTDAPNTGTAHLYLSRSGVTVTMGYDNLEGDSNLSWKVFDIPNISSACLVGFAVTAHNNGWWAAARFDNANLVGTPYSPTIGPGTRTLGATVAEMGVPFTVTITVPHLADATSVTIVEHLPPGSIATNISNGGVQIGDTIVWLFQPWTAPGATVTYDLIPQFPGNYGPLIFSGAYAEDNLGWQEAIADSSIFQKGTIAAFQQGVYPDASYAGCADAHIIVWRSWSDEYNTGAWDHLEEGDWNGGTGDHKKTLIRFDISSVPSTAPVDLALLMMYHDWSRNNAWNAHHTNVARLLKPWNEGRGNGSDGEVALTGEVSWQSAQRDVLPWESAGAMGVTDAYPPEAQSDIAYGNQRGVWVSWDVTASVKDFLTTPSENFGWKISQDVAQGIPDNDASNVYVQGAYNFPSRNNANASLRPILVLLDNTRYQTPIASASRSFSSSTWTWGNPTTVTLQVAAAAPGTSIVIREVLPAGWVADAVLDGGAEVSTGVLEWEIAPFTTAGATVRYVTRHPDWPDMPIAAFTEGSVRDTAGVVVDIPDSVIRHEGVAILQQGVWPDDTYSGCADAHIIVWRGDWNTGGIDHLEEGHWNGPTDDHKKILIRFDLSAAGVNASDVTLAELKLYYDWHRSGANPIHWLRTQPVLKAWNEGVGTGGMDGRAALDGEVTWNSAQHNVQAWDIPGVMASTDAGPFGPASAPFGDVLPTWVSLDVTQDVQDFLTTPSLNFGWKVSQDKVRDLPDNDAANTYVTDPNGAAFDFVSKDNPDAQHRPMLIIWTTSAVPVEVSRFMLY